MTNLYICLSGDIDFQCICKFGVTIHLEHKTGDTFVVEHGIASYLMNVYTE